MRWRKPPEVGQPAGGDGPVRIGRYRVVEKLGVGGFATVWRAFDEGLQDDVAVKVLFEHLQHEADIARRFVDEARILRKLACDRIVQVYEISDVVEAGPPYFVMEFGDRGTLDSRMTSRQRERPYTLAEALAISTELADCLTVVHDSNVVHRDVKPSNVLYRTIPAHRRRQEEREGLVPREERMLLGDFGVARQLDLKTTGSRAGTPLYMAPETLAPGDTVTVDRRADVYSAAVILYELLAGQCPFVPEWNGFTVVPRGSGPPPPLRAHRPDVPLGLEQVVERGLALHPDERFPTAWEWGESLRHWLFQISDVRPPHPGRRSRLPEGPPLIAELLGVCDQARPGGPAASDDPFATRISEARARLLGPLRIAVTGATGQEHALVQALKDLRPEWSVFDAPVGDTALRTAHAYVVLLPGDPGDGVNAVRTLRRVVRKRIGPASALGVVPSEESAAAHRTTTQIRSALPDLAVLAVDRPVEAATTLVETIESVFVSAEDVLRSLGAICDLEEAAAGGSDDASARLADRLEGVRIEAHQIDELRVAAEERAGLLELPDNLRVDLRRVLGRHSVTERLGLPDDAGEVSVQDAAARGAARWRAFANSGRATQAATTAAGVVALTYERLWTAAS